MFNLYKPFYINSISYIDETLETKEATKGLIWIARMITHLIYDIWYTKGDMKYGRRQIESLKILLEYENKLKIWKYILSSKKWQVV